MKQSFVLATAAAFFATTTLAVAFYAPVQAPTSFVLAQAKKDDMKKDDMMKKEEMAKDTMKKDDMKKDDMKKDTMKK